MKEKAELLSDGFNKFLEFINDSEVEEVKLLFNAAIANGIRFSLLNSDDVFIASYLLDDFEKFKLVIEYFPEESKKNANQLCYKALVDNKKEAIEFLIEIDGFPKPLSMLNSSELLVKPDIKKLIDNKYFPDQKISFEDLAPKTRQEARELLFYYGNHIFNYYFDNLPTSGRSHDTDKIVFTLMKYLFDYYESFKSELSSEEKFKLLRWVTTPVNRLSSKELKDDEYIFEKYDMITNNYQGRNIFKDLKFLQKLLMPLAETHLHTDSIMSLQASEVQLVLDELSAKLPRILELELNPDKTALEIFRENFTKSETPEFIQLFSVAGLYRLVDRADNVLERIRVAQEDFKSSSFGNGLKLISFLRAMEAVGELFTQKIISLNNSLTLGKDADILKKIATLIAHREANSANFEDLKSILNSHFADLPDFLNHVKTMAEAIKPSLVGGITEEQRVEYAKSFQQEPVLNDDSVENLKALLIRLDLNDKLKEEAFNILNTVSSVQVIRDLSSFSNSLNQERHKIIKPFTIKLKNHLKEALEGKDKGEIITTLISEIINLKLPKIIEDSAIEYVSKEYDDNIMYSLAEKLVNINKELIRDFNKSLKTLKPSLGDRPPKSVGEVHPLISEIAAAISFKDTIIKTEKAILKERYDQEMKLIKEMTEITVMEKYEDEENLVTLPLTLSMEGRKLKIGLYFYYQDSGKKKIVPACSFSAMVRSEEVLEEIRNLVLVLNKHKGDSKYIDFWVRAIDFGIDSWSQEHKVSYEEFKRFAVKCLSNFDKLIEELKEFSKFQELQNKYSLNILEYLASGLAAIVAASLPEDDNIFLEYKVARNSIRHFEDSIDSAAIKGKPKEIWLHYIMKCMKQEHNIMTGFITPSDATGSSDDESRVADCFDAGAGSAAGEEHLVSLIGNSTDSDSE